MAPRIRREYPLFYVLYNLHNLFFILWRVIMSGSLYRGKVTLVQATKVYGDVET